MFNRQLKDDLNLVGYFAGGASDLVFWSFRYFLGRRTIHTTVFARELAAAWPLLTENVQGLIRKELDQAFALHEQLQNLPEDPSPPLSPLGMDCDRAAWQLVRDAYANPASNPPTITHD